MRKGKKLTKFNKDREIKENEEGKKNRDFVVEDQLMETESKPEIVEKWEEVCWVFLFDFVGLFVEFD